MNLTFQMCDHFTINAKSELKARQKVDYRIDLIFHHVQEECSQNLLPGNVVLKQTQQDHPLVQK